MIDFEYMSDIPVPAEALFGYHEQPGAFERLCPPWEKLTIEHRSGGIQNGGVLSFKLHKGPLRISWLAKHEGYIPGARFVDVQEKGPFASWRHEHMIIPNGSQSVLHDHIRYALPGGWLGNALAGAMTRRKLQRMFRFRHQRTAIDLARHARFRGHRPRQVILAGQSTHLTRSLASFLNVGGHDIFTLAPRTDGKGSTYRIVEFFSGQPSHPLEGVDAVIFCDPTNQRKNPNVGDMIEQLHFLNQAIEPLARPPQRLIHLHPPDRRDNYTPNPYLDPAPSPHRHIQIQNKNEQLEILRDQCTQDIVLHCGEIIRQPMAYMVAVLMRLETFLFLRDGARSPSFYWVGQEDILGAVLHVLHDEKLDGDIAVTASDPITRADLQQAMIRRGYGGYIFHRMLKVTPWSSPGKPPGMNPALAELPNLRDKGFRMLAEDLETALNLSFGDDLDDETKTNKL